MDVNERRHRSIGAGLRYQKDEGPGIKASWEHRNLFHRGEKLELFVRIFQFYSFSRSPFSKTCILRTDQTLRLGLRLASDEPEAYRSENLTASGLVDAK
jgi:translocation and assembly module TamA